MIEEWFFHQDRFVTLTWVQARASVLNEAAN
jgi:hypothetical protein